MTIRGTERPRCRVCSYLMTDAGKEPAGKDLIEHWDCKCCGAQETTVAYNYEEDQ